MTFSSVNYPNDYGDKFNCSFTIEGGSPYVIVFTEMVIEENYDSIQVRIDHFISVVTSFEVGYH